MTEKTQKFDPTGTVGLATEAGFREAIDHGLTPDAVVWTTLQGFSDALASLMNVVPSDEVSPLARNCIQMMATVTELASSRMEVELRRKALLNELPPEVAGRLDEMAQKIVTDLAGIREGVENASAGEEGEADGDATK